jgi:16S rRNA (guanine527-N7)-methyltransferase
MTEDEALTWLRAAHVPRETFERLEAFVRILIDENDVQNLISSATLPHIWVRHIVDSAQLVPDTAWEGWLDIGTGAGFPGMVTAILTGRPHLLVEPRVRRADFLRRTSERLGLANATVFHGKAERVSGSYDVISARAVAPLSELLKMAAPLSHGATQMIFPKGRGAKEELAAARRSWQGRFELVPSITSSDSAIVVARGVVRRARP